MTARINAAVSMPSAEVSMREANAGLFNGAVKFGPFTGDTGNMNGPRRFVESLAGGVTTHNLEVVDMDMPGLSDQTQLHEHSLVFSVKIDRDDFAGKQVAMNLWQLNQFMAYMHREALAVYTRETSKTSYEDLSQVNLPRLIGSNSRLEILKFLSVREMTRQIHFVGVQFGNRYVNARSGPGIAVITSGTAVTRNTCLNEHTLEQDELWVVLRQREARGPLAYEFRSFTHQGGPRQGDRHFLDLAGRTAFGTAIKIGHIEDKMRPDMTNEAAKLRANGLQGTSEDSHWAELHAPPFRVVLSTNGLKAYQT